MKIVETERRNENFYKSVMIIFVKRLSEILLKVK